jgi:prepilin signal peptidase PulO-like enzyme (type II secretory pathway)
MALLVYDLKWMLLPNSIIYPTLLIAVAGKLIYLIGFEPHKSHSAALWALSVLAASGVFWFLYMISKGKWIGYGDVRLGLITGTLLQAPLKSLLMIFLASLIGSLTILPLISVGKRRLSAKIPYGPFLITATFICVLFGDSLINWYKSVFLP